MKLVPSAEHMSSVRLVPSAEHYVVHGDFTVCGTYAVCAACFICFVCTACTVHASFFVFFVCTACTVHAATVVQISFSAHGFLRRKCCFFDCIPNTLKYQEPQRNCSHSPSAISVKYQTMLDPTFIQAFIPAFILDFIPAFKPLSWLSS